ncbi:MAG: SPOR domain-containing protein [Candidatus Margulisbacteria bacterium]|nr:SPOR domain-containing protein [Candidatus Margulisiibacteriota bacterium]
MLDEYTDEFGTNLESKIPEFNTPASQGFVPSQAGVCQPRATGAPLENPQAQQYQLNPQYQPSQQQAYQPPIYQQYVYQPPQPPPAPPVYQQPYPAPPPAYTPPAQDRINSVFAEESQELNNLLKAEHNTGCLKNLLFILICLLVVAGSFSLSYLVGARVINQKNLVPSFAVTKGVKKIKRLMDSSDLVKDEKAFTNYSPPPAPPKAILPPEVQYTPPPAAPPPKPAVQTARPAASPAVTGTLYRVVVGNFDTRQEAADVAVNVRADGFPVYQYQADGKHRLQIGAFKSKALSTALLKKAGEYGYNAYISIK